MPGPLPAFVTNGAWGNGTGSPLAPAVIDQNFYGLHGRIGALEDNPPTPVEVTNIVQAGNRLTFYFSDGSTRGPFTLPANNLRARGAWSAATVYSYNDWFHVDHRYIYVVQVGHTSASTFDPAAEDGSGNALYLLAIDVNALNWRDAWSPATQYAFNDFFHIDHQKIYVVQVPHTSAGGFSAAYVPPGSSIPAYSLMIDTTVLIGGGGGGIAGIYRTNSQGPINPTLGQANYMFDLYYWQLADQQNNTNEIEFVIPNDATINYPVGTQFHFRRSGNNIDVYPASGAVLDYPDGKVPKSGPYGRVFSVIKLSANYWYAFGDMRDTLSTINITAATYDLLVETFLSRHHVNHATGCTITLLNGSSRKYIVDSEWHFYQMGAGKITFDAPFGTLYCKGVNKRTTGQYAVAKLRYLGGDLWMLYGDVE